MNGKELEVRNHEVFYVHAIKDTKEFTKIGLNKKQIDEINLWYQDYRGINPFPMIEYFIMREFPIMKATVFGVGYDGEISFTYDSGVYTTQALEIVFDFSLKRKPGHIIIENNKTSRTAITSWNEIKEDTGPTKSKLGSAQKELVFIARQLIADVGFKVGDKVQDMDNRDEYYFQKGKVLQIKYPYITVGLDIGKKLTSKYFNFRKV